LIAGIKERIHRIVTVSQIMKKWDFLQEDISGLGRHGKDWSYRVMGASGVA
jgi:hypothetical protein